MVIICNICLRSDLNLRTLSEELESFYEELCNFSNITGFQFCSVCIYKLIKCYEFKKMCILAGEKLKTWRKTKKNAKTPKNLLHTEMPTSLGVSNNNNRKAYYYQDSKLLYKLDITHLEVHSYPRNIKISKDNEFNDTHIKEEIHGENNDFKEEISVVYNTTKEIDGTENDTTGKISVTNYTTGGLCVISDTTNEISVIENDTTKEISVIENDTTKEISLIENDLEDVNHQDLNDTDSDSDESLKELISKIKEKKKLLKQDKKNRVISVKNKKFDIEDLKCLLKLKFERHGEVRDDKGNTIDPDTVLSNLDKYSDLNLIILKRICLDPGPFKPNAIQRLSKIQDRFKAYEKVFQMTYLSDEKQMAEEFENRRKYPDYLEHEHRCEKCIKGFRNAKTLENHHRIQHNESLPYSCTFCQSHFGSLRMVQAHVMRYHTMVYRCKLCANFITNCRTLMLSHYSKHTGLVTTCKDCGKQYLTKSSFYLHVRTAHVSRHVCTVCAGAFHNRTGLNRHAALSHHGEKFTESLDNVKCEPCDITFLNSDVYNKHISVTHNASEEKDIPRKRRKLNTCERSKYVYACRLCDWKGTSTLSRVHHHTQVHPKEDMQAIYGARKHLCHSCGKGFNDKQSYTYHMNKHTNTRPYVCPKCSKRFHSRNNLNIHVERHLPPKHQCQCCEKKFTTKIGLRSHMKTHIGDRRYKCEICGKGFLYSTALKEHVNGVHLQIRRKRKQCVLEDN